MEWKYGELVMKHVSQYGKGDRADGISELWILLGS